MKSMGVQPKYTRSRLRRTSYISYLRKSDYVVTLTQFTYILHLHIKTKNLVKINHASIPRRGNKKPLPNKINHLLTSNSSLKHKKYING